MKKGFWLILLWLSSSTLAWADDWQVTLRPGDSLWSICERLAQQPDMCWRELANYNEINNPHRIQPGDRLRVPIDWLKEKPVPATLQAVSGEVMLYPADGGAARRLQDGDQVRFGDALETSGDGSAVLRFADRSEIEIKPGSLMVVNSYRRFLDRPAEDTELRLQHGAIRSRVAPQDSQGGRYRVYTPGAVAAVRGTVYDIRVDNNETTRGEVLSGAVDLSAQGLTLGVDGGYATLARQGQVPLEPRPMLPAPDMVVNANGLVLNARWPAQAEANHYWLELYQLPGEQLLEQYNPDSDHWQATLPEGSYQLRLRAVDEHGLRGLESVAEVTVRKPEPVAEPEPEDNRGVWVFFSAALLLLLL